MHLPKNIISWRVALERNHGLGLDGKGPARLTKCRIVLDIGYFRKDFMADTKHEREDEGDL